MWVSRKWRWEKEKRRRGSKWGTSHSRSNGHYPMLLHNDTVNRGRPLPSGPMGVTTTPMLTPCPSLTLLHSYWGTLITNAVSGPKGGGGMANKTEWSRRVGLSLAITSPLLEDYNLRELVDILITSRFLYNSMQNTVAFLGVSGYDKEDANFVNKQGSLR